MMSKRSRADQFLDAYRAAFEASDVLAIADLFSYPCQVTSDAGEITVTTVRSREAWLPQIHRLLAAYRAIGIRSAQVLELQMIELTPATSPGHGPLGPRRPGGSADLRVRRLVHPRGPRRGHPDHSHRPQ